MNQNIGLLGDNQKKKKCIRDQNAKLSLLDQQKKQDKNTILSRSNYFAQINDKNEENILKKDEHVEK